MRDEQRDGEAAYVYVALQSRGGARGSRTRAVACHLSARVTRS